MCSSRPPRRASPFTIDRLSTRANNLASDPLTIAKTADGNDLGILAALANRHGLITGATGTGKTVTLQVMTERFSKIGVPVFLADVKGDLAGLAEAGAMSPKLEERLKAIKADA